MPTKGLQTIPAGILEGSNLIRLTQELQTGPSVGPNFPLDFQGIQTAGLKARHTADHFLEVPAPVPAPAAVATQVRAV